MIRYPGLKVFLSLALLAACTGSAKAEETSSITGTASAGFYSDYMFRGQNLYDGASIQPSLTLNYDAGFGTLTGNLWAHLSAESESTPNKFTEVDETIKFSRTCGDLTWSVGNIWYSYPDKDDDIKSTAEVFASFTYNTTLLPTLSVYHDWDEYDLQYYELNLSHKFEAVWGEGFSPTPFVAFGFASNSEKLYDEDGLEHVTTGAFFDVPLGRVNLVPTLNYTFKVDDTTVNELWFGTALNYNF